MKKTINVFRNLITAIIIIASMIAVNSVLVFADTNIESETLAFDFEASKWSYDGYTAYYDPCIMGERNRKFRTNDDFMILLEKDGEIYTGGDLKIKIAKQDSKAVYVRIIKIKGVAGTKKAFKHSELIKFWKASEIATISPIEREPGEIIPVTPDPSQSENEKEEIDEVEYVLFSDRKEAKTGK